MRVFFCCIEGHRVITRHCNEPNRNMADKSQQNECDNQPSEFHNVDGFYKHIFFVLLCILHQQIFIIFCEVPMNFLRHTHCYLLSHCQFEHPVYLSTPSEAKRSLHSYQHLHCDYSTTAVTLSVLELVQLAALALRLQYHSCDTVCAGTGTVSSTCTATTVPQL